ncbi:capsular exopolysaccharide family [Cyclobacterium xiamenense]|uniref:non-specific protein-tyrosine kinase n=1 Tax=Cyclobacterium xiamenense TaxID=1297121 RepID=A0A1H7C0I7_9BACT|nr:polysaccharide biosynthesis tyrosine autokinase [Cyclobacterium xiamenense]SEJ80492.1 capsular exopolysaccharide family [Cyclobacterium xiamenense]
MENLDLSKFEEQEKPIDIKYYIIKYFRYWPLYLFCILIGLLAVFLFHRYTVERFEVKGSVLIKSNLSPEVRILDRSNIFSGGENLTNDILLFSSKNLAAEALEKVHFDVSYFASTNIKEIELYTNSPIRVDVDWDYPQIENRKIRIEILSDSTFQLLPGENMFFDRFFMSYQYVEEDRDIFGKEFYFGEPVVGDHARFTVHQTTHSPQYDTYEFLLHSPQSLIDSYAGSVQVRPLINYGSVLEVSMTTKIVEKGSDYVNALMDSFLEYDLREKNQISENALRFIEEQLFIVEDSLNSVERRMQRFKVDNKMLDVDAEFGGVLNSIQLLEENIQSIDFELAYYTALKDYLLTKSDNFEEIVAPSLIGITDGLLSELIQQLVDQSLERRKLLTAVRETHPDVAALDRQIGRLKENIFENIENLVTNTENKKKQYQQKLAAFDRQFANLPQAESNYSSIFREFKLRENLYTYLLEKRAEAGIAKASNVPDNSIVDYAKRGILIYPKKTQNYSYALGLGFFLPLGFLLLFHYLNNRIMDQVQLKNLLRIPLLGTIGFSDKDTNLLVAEHPRSLASESFRSLRSALFYIASEKKCKKILVTSSVSGEGKTYISLNLASAMALSGKKTCIIGLDLRKPKLSTYLDISSKKGLSGYLIDKDSADEIIVPTAYDNLFVVPSGPVPPNPAELLLKTKMNDFLDRLEKEFDIIVMDCPPVGLVSETMDLLRFSDVNLYIVRHDFTHKNQLLMINDLYANDQIRNFYAIFNGLKSGGDTYDFGGYNYGYGYNYSYMKKNRYGEGYYAEEPRYRPGWFKKLINRFKV